MILPLSVDRRLRDSASRVFRTLQNLRKKKSMVTGVVLNRTREFLMKKMVHLVLFTLVLLGGISSSSFAEGGAPPPMCSPSHCPGK
jgi:hypothetical protein